MTPEENQLVAELFGRLAKLENNPRDPQAERLIADGLQRAPHAVYALVQTALVQEEALRRASEQIEELQSRLGDSQAQAPRGGFLDSMREAVLGRRDPQVSAPAMRSPPTQAALQREPAYQAQELYPSQTPPGRSPGGSFLGNAASTAAGVVGGSLLLNSIRSAFGGRPASGEQDRSAFGGFGERTSPAAGARDRDPARDPGRERGGQDNDRDAEHANPEDAASSDTPDDADFADNADFDEDTDLDDQDDADFDDDDIDDA